MKIKHRPLLDQLRADVKSLRVQPGEKLPPARFLAAELGLAAGTISRVYREAAAEGLVVSEVGRGTRVADARPHSLDAAQLGPIDLSIDYPLQSLDPDPRGALETIARSAGRLDMMGYQLPGGSSRAKAAGSIWMDRFGVACQPDDVLVCGGGQHALMIALATAAVERGRGPVFAETLAYPGLREAASLLGLQVVPIAMDAGGMIPDALAEACASHQSPTAVYLVPSLHNPTTAAMPEDRRSRIASIAAKHDLLIIEDDVHRLHADDQTVSTFMGLVPERVFFIAGFSKTVTAGLRIAFLAPPEGKVDATARSLLATNWALPALTAEIASMWIEDGTADTVCRAKADEAAFRQELARSILPAASIRTQRRSFYLWIDLPEAWSGDSFALAAARRGVSVLGDRSFRSAPNADAFAGARVCLGAARDRSTLAVGLEALRDTLVQPANYMPGIV